MIASIVLAAGLSRRMGGINKLAHPFAGKSLVCWAVDAALDLGLGPVIVVTGHQQEVLNTLIGTRPVQQIHNPDYQSGMASSLVAGIKALPPQAIASFILLGDMPYIRSTHLSLLATKFDGAGRQSLIVPTHHGQRGHPVLCPAHLFEAFLTLTGDRGGKAILDNHPDKVVEMEMADRAVVFDIDHKEGFSEDLTRHFDY